MTIITIHSSSTVPVRSTKGGPPMNRSSSRCITPQQQQQLSGKGSNMQSYRDFNYGYSNRSTTTPSKNHSSGRSPYSTISTNTASGSSGSSSDYFICDPHAWKQQRRNAGTGHYNSSNRSRGSSTQSTSITMSSSDWSSVSSTSTPQLVREHRSRKDRSFSHADSSSTTNPNAHHNNGPKQDKFRDEPEKKKFVKTELCGSFPFVEDCLYGKNCNYAHCKEELTLTLLVERHEEKMLDKETFMTRPCLNFVSTGSWYVILSW